MSRGGERCFLLNDTMMGHSRESSSIHCEFFFFFHVLVVNDDLTDSIWNQE